MKEIIKDCKKHGLTDHILEGRGAYRCKTCRSNNLKNFRKNRRIKLIEYFGGKCTACGYNKSTAALHFHHRNPEEKSFGLSYRGLTRSWEKTLEEANKCDLVCSNCHAEIHEALEKIKNI